jgi:hypothetical protein
MLKNPQSNEAYCTTNTFDKMLMLRSDPALIEKFGDANLQRVETKDGTYAFSHLLAMR